MTTIGEALGTLGDVLVATGNELHDVLIKIFNIVEGEEKWEIINQAIAELSPPFEEIVQILHKRQLQGLNVNKNKIGEYSKRATISKEKAEEKLGRDLSHIKFINMNEIEVAKYNWLKFHEVSNVAGFGNVDLNFSNNYLRVTT